MAMTLRPDCASARATARPTTPAPTTTTSIRSVMGAPGSTRLEVVRRQLVTPEELVEVRAIALGETGRLAHVAARDLQDLREIIARELVARFVEGRELRRAAAERLLHEFRIDDRIPRQRDVVPHDVVELADVAGPFGRGEQFDRLRRIDLALVAVARDELEEMRDQQWNVLAPLRER